MHKKICNALWLGFSIPDELSAEIFSLDPLPAVQTHKFGWSFARALNSVCKKLVVVSACPVQNFPIVNKILFKKSKFCHSNIEGYLIGFVNFLILKHISRLITCCITATKVIRLYRIKLVFVHGVHTPFLLFAMLARFFGCRVIVVLTDPPGMLLPSDGKTVRIMKFVDAYITRFLLQYVNAVLSLAPQLSRNFAPHKPTMVFPGIVDTTQSSCNLEGEHVASIVSKMNGDYFTILYAGGLSAAYGIDRLLESILELDPKISVILKLFGRGDQEYKIARLSSSNHRIYYGGFLDPNNLRSELCAADLLINPRPTDRPFASMSFPSKLLEYLATGRPVLTTRISSIPDDLKDKFYYIENESTSGIRDSIIRVMSLSHQERSMQGLAARKFVLKNYSENAIGDKIAEFVGTLN